MNSKMNLTAVRPTIEALLGLKTTRETDYTVAAYITRVRMRTAMKLLNDCRNKVYEVAEQVGYRDVAHFSSSFKRIVGVTPSEYQDRSM